VHSSTLVTAGVVFLMKFSFGMSLVFTQQLIFIFGCLTIFLGGLVAITEKDFKKIVALSTLSQIGLLFFIFGCGLFLIC
jgi:NADH:ubiquinone oxidoreductase subunit 5 (subunit L)/multisubunit Na+/H+ antiporter MnhA subunit